MRSHKKFGRGFALAAAAAVVLAMLPLDGAPLAGAAPGSAGTPQLPTVAYPETFQTQVPGTLNNTPVAIANFKYPDLVASTQKPYSADPAWTAGAGNCNGWVLNYNSAAPGDGCGTNGGVDGNNGAQTAWFFLQHMAAFLGYMAVKNGYQTGPTDYSQNNVVASQTNGGDQAATQGIQAQATNVVMTKPGHYYAVAVDFVEAHCPNFPGGKAAWTAASETLYLQINGVYVPMIGDGTLAGGINTCGDTKAGHTGVTVPGLTKIETVGAQGTIPASAIPNTTGWNNTTYAYTHLVSHEYQATTVVPLGLRVYNANNAASGNDVAFDNIEILDVTPQLDKKFAPTPVPAGKASTLTWTITNTADLDAKDGWGFIDHIADGLTVVPGSATTDCNDSTYAPTASTITTTDGQTYPIGPNGAVTVSGDGRSVMVTGNLKQGVASCTASIKVISTEPGTYSNNGDNIDHPWGINPPDGCTDPAGCETPPPGGTDVTVVSNPALKLTKTASTGLTSDAKNPMVTTAGQTVTYSIKIENTGDVPIDHLTLKDIPFSGAGGSTALSTPVCTPYPADGSDAATLPDGATTTCTVTYQATQADIDAAAQITNSATASGHGLGQPDTTITDSNTGTAVVDVVPSNGLTLQKSVAITDKDGNPLTTINEVGDKLTYTFLVANNGTTTITGLTIVDGTSDSYAGVHTPGFSGTGTLSGIDCATTTLGPKGSPTASTTCTATYIVTPDDLDFSGVYNTAKATGTDPLGDPVESQPAAAQATVHQDPKLTITKSHLDVANRPVTDPDTGVTTMAPVNVATSPAKAGDVVTFEFLVKNTGNIDLTDVGVTDTMVAIENPVECPEGNKGGLSQDGKIVLEPGEWVVCSADYTLTVADLDRGWVLNPQAQAHGTGHDTIIDPETGDETPTTVPVYSNYDYNLLPLPAAPAVTLEKSETVPTGGVTKAEQQVTYGFLITNTGNVTLSNLTLSDPGNNYIDDKHPGFSGTGTWNWGMDICPSASLAPGASETCYATYVVTQADVDAGWLANTATVMGTPPAQPGPTAAEYPPNYTHDPYTPTPLEPVTSGPSNVYLDINPISALTLSKTATPTTVTAANQAVSFRFLVTNSGDTTLEGIVINETAFSGSGGPLTVTCPADAGWPSGKAGTLAPGGSVTCTAPYTTTQQDVDAGVITNTATASGTSLTGDPATSPPSDATVDVTQRPALLLIKQADVSDIPNAGGTVTYTFLLRNTGNVTVKNITITEKSFTGTPANLSGLTCPATGTPGWPGDAWTLVPGEEIECSATYTTTQTDVDDSDLANTATATGKDPGGGDVVSNDSTVELPTDPHPALTLVKTASPATVTAAGQTVTYSFVVTNTGNLTVKNLAITETDFSGSGTLLNLLCPVTTLAPHATTTCTATYTVTLADMNRGSITNTAHASGTDPSGGPVTSEPDDATVTAAQAPALTLAKTASPTSVTAKDQTVTYSFLVTNTGNVTVTGVTITETAFSGTGTPSAITCPTTSLDPGDSTSCTATYAVTQADINAGLVTNTARATGKSPTNSTVTSNDSSATVTAPPNPALTLAKTANPTTVTAKNQTVTYSFLVTNTGNVTVTDIAITDAPFSGTGTLSAIGCPVTTLNPGDHTTCTATYAVTQADIDAGVVTNTAHATGKSPTNAPVTSNESSAEVTATRSPALTLLKQTTATDIPAAGGTVNYTFLVTNSGNVTVHGITIAETAFNGTLANLTGITCPASGSSWPGADGVLAPGESVTCSTSYTTTQADVDSGDLENTAVATGANPAGGAVTSNPSSVTLPKNPAPALTLLKSANPTTVTAKDQTVTYSFLVTNSGNVTVHGITVAETAFNGTAAQMSAITCPVTTLGPGASTTCTATYQVTLADMNRGSVANTAEASGLSPTDGDVTSNTSSATVNATQTPGISIEKTHVALVGNPVKDTVVTFSFLVTNTGNVTLHDIVVTDELAGVTTPSCPVALLDPGAETTCTATYALTQADIDAGSLPNTADVIGTSPTGVDVVDDDSDTVPLPAAPALTIAKAVTPTSATVPGPVAYSFEVENTGNVTLTSIGVTETAASFSGLGTLPIVSCPVSTLAPGASTTCTATYLVTQEDIDAGDPIDNTATAHGTAPGASAPTNSTPSSAEVTVSQAPALKVEKSVSPIEVTEPGDVTYTYVVTNTGDVTVHGIVINETASAFTGHGPLPTPTCATTTLAPLAHTTCTAVYHVTQEDIDQGSVHNTATATGLSPKNITVPSGPSTATVTAPKTASLSLVKSVSPTAVSKPGQVTYSFLVTNTGNVTITGVSITEQAFSGSGTRPVASCPTTPLLPRESMTCTATYDVTSTDIAAKGVTNTAIAAGVDPGGVAVQSLPSSAALHVGALSLTKTADVADVYAASDVVHYQLKIQNMGDVTLTGVAIADAFTAHGITPTITCPAAGGWPSGVLGTLDPGDLITCTATYTVTQDDMDTGDLITNTASASGKDPSNGDVVSPDSTWTVTPHQAASLTLDKKADVASVGAKDAPVKYTFTVKNTGNVTLSGVKITEGAFTGSGTLSAVTCPAAGYAWPGTAGVLRPGQTVVCSATYKATQADIDAEATLVNKATASGVMLDGTEIVSPEAQAPVDVVALPDVKIVKTGVLVNGHINYTFTVTNIGNTTLKNIVVTDGPFTGRGATPVPVCPPGVVLAPGGIMICTATYATVTGDAGTDISNTAVVTAQDPAGHTVDSPSSTVVVDPPSQRSNTGGSLWGMPIWPFVVAGALVLVAAGLLIVLGWRRRREDRSDGSLEG